MKKISILFLLSANVLFLTGCLGWKKKQTISVDNQPLKIDNNSNDDCNSSIKISFTEDNPDYTLTTGKTIFDDNNNELENNTIIIDQAVINPENNCLNNLILQEETHINNQDNSIKMETAKSHIATLLFDFDIFEHLRPEYENALKVAIAQIQLAIEKNPNLNIIIEGHACNSCGSERYNLELSNHRAITIKNKILQNTNINPEKLSVFGCGTSHLIVHGGRYEQGPNRRVEIFIVNN